MSQNRNTKRIKLNSQLPNELDEKFVIEQNEKFVDSIRKHIGVEDIPETLKLPYIDINYRTSNFKFTALMIAAWIGNTDTVKILLNDPNICIECQNQIGATALMLAMAGNNREIAYLLVNHYKSYCPECKDINNKTALMIAAKNGYTEIVEILLKTGKACPECKDNYGFTALMYAADNGHTEIVDLLLNSGQACPEYKNDDGFAAISFATKIDIIKLLLPFSSYDMLGNTIIYNILKNGGDAAPIIEFLLEYNPTLAGYINRNGFTPLIRILTVTTNKDNIKEKSSTFLNPFPIVLMLLKTGHSRPWHIPQGGFPAYNDARTGYNQAIKNNNDDRAEMFKHIMDLLSEYKQFPITKNSYVTKTAWYNICADMSIYNLNILIEKSKSINLPVYDSNNKLKTKSELCEQLSRAYYDFIQYVNYVGIERDKNKFYKSSIHPDVIKEEEKDKKEEENKLISAFATWDDEEFKMMDPAYYVSDEKGRTYTLDEIYMWGVKDKTPNNMYINPVTRGKWSPQFIKDYETKNKYKTVAFGKYAPYSENTINIFTNTAIPQKNQTNILKQAAEKIAYISETDYQDLMDPNIMTYVINYIKNYNEDTRLEAIRTVKIPELGNKTFLKYIEDSPEDINKLIIMYNAYIILENAQYEHLNNIIFGLKYVFEHI